MFILHAFKLLIKHYIKIVPFYLLAIIITGALISFSFPIGFLLALPVSIGIAHYLTHVAITKGEGTYSSIFLGYSRGTLFRNLFYLLIRPLLIIAILALFLGPIYSFIDSVNEDMFVSIIPSWNDYQLVLIIVFTVVVLLTPLSLLPYILADPECDTFKKNPLILSATLIQWNYIPLVIVRILYAMWLAFISLILITVPFLFVAIVFSGGEGLPEFQAFLRIFWIFVLLHFLFFAPLYRMIHTALYIQLRKHIKTASDDAA